MDRCLMINIGDVVKLNDLEYIGIVTGYKDINFLKSPVRFCIVPSNGHGCYYYFEEELEQL